ncbi:acetate--CoA ligase [Acinetobacter radioresistens]|uniref:Acetyl-coenzyme A synthetase n=1 Tax=Acinetobacter radioresistens SK82 TaxID=596318 RepID=A0ABM9YM68_ACIRA|nr:MULTISPECIES: acetate--CoA ligase [Acinetobacter]EET81983.1 acetate--CoA ligase [Acinetobacter radioresistens SK82]EEY85870.1 acetate--CoA ligase [Acinetobacter radioresistens SH164]ENV85555.1 acetate-CoA ligase [Acinetobacter radioresistens NIPH 2130]EXE59974.1 acetate--CoA ligase [Acinetobacter sp. 1239920]MBA5697617.1 acetate--CoA ligase [Acinetobacter radioresistens]
MSEIYPVPEEFKKTARTVEEDYLKRYQHSIEQPEEFWAEEAKRIDWIKPFIQVKNSSFAADNFKIEWFADGQLNVSANCLDRHLKEHPHKPAIIWEGDHPSRHKIISFKELHDEVCRFANALKKYGIVKGDRVVLYMPMVSEAAIAMLACARIGAVHCVVFGGFSPDSLASRIEDSQAKMVITADAGMRGGKLIPLKESVNQALEHAETDSVEHVVVVHRTGNPVEMKPERDLWYHEVITEVNEICPPEPMNAEDPLFILYTSGSTGKPKGVLHTTGGYLVYVNSTFREVFDIKQDDIYWCTADVGWITGHSYIIYGPLSNGTTTVMFEGVPQYPSWARVGHIVDKHNITILYTAPTAIRAMMREGDAYVRESDRSSLRLLGSVGEPINPEAWSWYYNVVGEGRCPIVDTWWQTETGGILISPLPGATDLKPGSATRPYFGVQPAIVDGEGKELDGAAEGNLIIKDSWPGQMRTIWGDPQRFIEAYFSTFPGNYFTGDGARRDEDGYYWITGRVDDVLNVSGHRLGTAEIESALVAHDHVAEAAVVGMPHEIKGQGICTFVTLQAGVNESEELRQELVSWVRKQLGPVATPDALHWAPALPKTRSGKIMRRILRKIAANELDSLGDTSTLAEPAVVEQLIVTVYPGHK